MFKVLATLAYKSAENVIKLYESAKPDFFIVGLNTTDEKILKDLSVLLQNRNVVFLSMGGNAGVAKGWNLILVLFQKGLPIVIANDDITFVSSDWTPIAEALDKTQPIQTILGYSCFVINTIALHKIGLFDENFYPAYYEDCDYDYRVRLAGYNPPQIDFPVNHIGSYSISTLEPEPKNEFWQMFTRNQNFYIQKWGGLNGEETYTKPFGNQ